MLSHVVRHATWPYQHVLFIKYATIISIRIYMVPYSVRPQSQHLTDLRPIREECRLLGCCAVLLL
jgi:hypothetical protein